MIPRISRSIGAKLFAVVLTVLLLTLAALGVATVRLQRKAFERARYASALDVGCSIGVLTRSLAERCDVLVGLDLTERALSHARARCSDMPHIRF